MKQALCLCLLLFAAVDVLATEIGQQTNGYTVASHPVDTTTPGRHHHKEPVVIADGDRIFAAWISFSSPDNPSSARIQVATTTDLAQWQRPVTLNSTYGEGTAGDPFFALNPLTHEVYLVGVGGHLEEILLWKEEDFTNPTPPPGTQICHRVYLDVDKPSVTVSPSGEIYVAHLTGNSIHVHRLNNLDQKWYVLELSTAHLDASPQSPIVVVYRLPGTNVEKISVLFEDYKGTEEDRIIAWTSPVADPGLWTSTNPENPVLVDDPEFVSRPIGRLLLGNESPVIAGVEGTREISSMLMARYNDATGKIGVVWHERKSASSSGVRFVELNPDPEHEGLGTPTGPVIAGNQFHPAIAANPDGSYMVSYYDTPESSINYNLKVAHISGDGQFAEPILIPGSSSTPAGYETEVGEYQDIRYAPESGSWYASFIRVTGTCPDCQCPNCQGDTYVAKITPCTITVSPTSVPPVPASGGSVHFDVTMTPEGCGSWMPTWSVSPPPDWASIDNTATRDTSGSFNVTVQANTDSQRQATITVDGNSIVITQQAQGCATLPRRASVAPQLASRTDHPVLAVFGEWEGTFYYDWYERLPEETTPRLLFKHTSSISVTPSQPLTYYSGVVRNACGQTASLAEVPLYLCVPTIDTQPADQVVPRGGSASLTVAASPAIAGQPMTYTWWSYDTGQIVGSGPTLNVTPAPGTTRVYYAHVNTDCSGIPFSVQARAATVTGCELAATAYSDRSIAPGQTVTLSASIAGTQVLPSDTEYTWYYGPEPGTEYVSGVGLWSITPTPQTTTTYWVRVKDGTCTAESNPVTVRICVPVITSQPQGTLIRAGQTTSLSVGVTPLNNETLYYQWYAGAKGDVTNPVSGATSSTFTTPALTATTSYWVRVTSSCGATTDSAAAVVTVCNNPVINSVTPTRYIRYGGSASHQVSATGNNLTYQWYIGSSGNTSVPMKGSTLSSISQSPSNTTTYWARITSSSLCTTDSPAMVIDVCTDPPITTQPASATINSGQPATLTVATSATGATYQWYLGTGAAIQGATSASLTVTPTADTQYSAQVTRGACTSTSDTATVTVCALAVSLAGGTNIASGQNATLTASVSNTRGTYVSVEWYAGTGTNSLLIASGSGLGQKTVSPANTTQYWVRVSDGTCTVDSTPVTVRVCVPVIASQPQGTVIRANQTASLSVGVTPLNNETLQYQWYVGAKGDVTHPVSGATSSTFTTPALTATTSYWVRVTSSCNATTDSAAAVVTVCNNPVISSVTPTRYIRYGGSASHQVSATGNNLTYQWYTGSPGNTSVPIQGSTLSSLSQSPASTTTYWARVASYGLCTIDSPAMVIDVCTDPPITTQPAPKTINSGQSATLTVATSVSGATYQWFLGTGAIIQGATSSSLTVTPAADTQYFAQVTRGACTSTSDTATVTVCTLAASLSGGTNIASGQSATLYAGVSSSRDTYPSYEWYAGTGASSYVIGSGQGLSQKTVTPSVTTQYWVRISDGICTADSAPVTVSVCKPTITAQPQGKTVNSGQTATLSVTATGAPLSYQWYIGAAGNTAQPIAGATSASYTTPPMSATTSYWVRVTGCTTADSTSATVTVCALPAITSGPTADTQRYPNTWGWMLMTASGTNLTYQWFTGQSGDTSQPVPGCTSANCNFLLTTSKYYWVRINGTCGTLNSPAVIHPVSPTITQQPQSAAVPPNATPTLSLTATGTDLTYQWYRGSTGNTATPMSGATAATFTVPPVTTAPVSYWCKVTSVGNSTAIDYSAEATISFCTGPSTYGPYAQYFGYNQWMLSVGAYLEEDMGNFYCAWYTGVPGNVAQSVFQYEGGNYTYVTATGTQTWWCRAWYNDHSCYTDSGGATIYKVQ
jgi:hypothetical protein